MLDYVAAITKDATSIHEEDHDALRAEGNTYFQAGVCTTAIGGVALLAGAGLLISTLWK